MKYKSKSKDQLLDKTTEIRHLLVQTEQYQNLASQVLELLNQTDSRTDMIKDILLLVKAATGFEAVGIRLKDGEDFPYYETIGFSKEFVRAERSLCAKDQSGELVRDSEGNPYLECMCGNIICGRTDPSLSFFTEGGSFWSNCTTELLASTTDADRQGRTRNRCNGEGYESVALIPIHYNKEIIGLLQLNDSRRNLFTLKSIRFFEDFVSSIGIAIKNKQRSSTILKSKEKVDTVTEASIAFYEEPDSYCKFFHHSPIGVLEEDFSQVKHCIDNLKKNGIEDFREYFTKHPEAVLSFADKIKILAVNKVTLSMLKVKNKEELCQRWNAVFNKDSFDVFREKFIALAQEKTEFSSAPVNLMLQDKEKTIHLKLVVPSEYKETLSRVFLYIIDGSDMKRQTEQLKESEDKYRKIVEDTHDAIILADLETGIIIYCNKKAEELLELTTDEIAGVHFSELHPSEVTEDYRMIFQNPLKEGITIRETLFACRKCNENITVSVSSKVITLKGIKYVSAIFRVLKSCDKNELRSFKFQETRNRSSAKGDTLSQREREVLNLIISGKSAKHIAKEMYISENTVRTHRMRIMQKLDMHKTADLVRYAIQSGLLD